MSDELHQEQAPPAAPPPEVKSGEPQPAPGKNAEQKKLLAALSYFGLLVLVPLLIAKDDSFVQFHVKQGIVWFVVWVIASFIIWMPFLGWSIGVAMFAVSVFAAIQAYEGKRWEMPYLSKYAKTIKL